MAQTKLRYSFVSFILFAILQSSVHAGPVKADSSEPAPRMIMLLVKFKQGEKGITATIVTAGLVNGIIKNKPSLPSDNNVMFYINTLNKENADSLLIPSPLQEQYEYPTENNKMAYKTMAVKENTVLLRFAWQPGLKSLVWNWPLTNNKLAPTSQELLLPKSIIQPD